MHGCALTFGAFVPKEDPSTVIEANAAMWNARAAGHGSSASASAGSRVIRIGPVGCRVGLPG